MNEYDAGVFSAAVETFDCPEPILEVGSHPIEGEEHIANLGSLLPGKKYIGVDRCFGPGVDSVEDVEELAHHAETVGTIIALNLLEHVPRFWNAFNEIQRVLRPDGLLMVITPFYFRIHNFPRDYWRFTPDAMHLLLQKLPSKIIGYHGPSKRPLSVWGVAGGREYPRITEQQHLQFRERIKLYARQRPAWDKRLRYRIGRMLCGKRPFASLLEAENVETVLINTL